jgi:general secretion pathway protein C
VTALLFASGPLWLRQRAPLIVGVLLLFAMCVSLARQTVEWINLMRAPTQSVTAEPQVAQEAPLLDRLGPLFGPAPAADGRSTPNTNLDLVLLGSFIHSDPSKSSVIIQKTGQAPTRYLNGSKLNDSTRIRAIYRDHVELERDGRLEQLTFPVNRASASSPEPADIGEPEESEDEKLQRHMEALREQMEKAGEQDLLPPDQPTESD